MLHRFFGLLVWASMSMSHPHHNGGGGGVGDSSWDYLVFAQVWPTSICTVSNDEKPNSCEVPEGNDWWTIHGLWPSKFDGDGPEFCPATGKRFDPTRVEPIETDLEARWPNLIPTAGETSLWKHEWEKHGSCASSLRSLDGELNYFGEGLRLNHGALDLLKVLNDQGIRPSRGASNDGADFANAIRAATGKAPLIHCVRDPNGVWYVADIRICLDKDFNPIDCPHRSRQRTGSFRQPTANSALPEVQSCPTGENLYYPTPSSSSSYHGRG